MRNSKTKVKHGKSSTLSKPWPRFYFNSINIISFILIKILESVLVIIIGLGACLVKLIMYSSGIRLFQKICLEFIIAVITLGFILIVSLFFTLLPSIP